MTFAKSCARSRKIVNENVIFGSKPVPKTGLRSSFACSSNLVHREHIQYMTRLDNGVVRPGLDQTTKCLNAPLLRASLHAGSIIKKPIFGSRGWNEGPTWRTIVTPTRIRWTSVDWVMRARTTSALGYWAFRRASEDGLLMANRSFLHLP